MMKKLTTCILIIYFSPLKSQESIQTDRPDQTESVSITPKKFIQIETGFLYEKADGGSRNFVHPNILWKYGINENFEVRLITEFLTEKTATTKLSGFSPLAFGFKAKLTDEKRYLPKISFLAHITANKLSSEEFKTHYPASNFRFLFQHTLSDRLNLGYNLGAEWNGETPGPTGIYTISGAYAVTDKLGGFVESYGFISESQNADHRFNGGITYLVNENLQADLSSGFEISKTSPDYHFSCGISYRFSTYK